MTDTYQPYELLYGYQHCTGRTQYPAGRASTREAARQWVDACISQGKRMVVPPGDPVRWCPVHHCHMKRQRPWFGYRMPDGLATDVRVSRHPSPMERPTPVAPSIEPPN